MSPLLLAILFVAPPVLLALLLWDLVRPARWPRSQLTLSHHMLRYVAERTPNYDVVNSLGFAIQAAVAKGTPVATVLAAIVDQLPQEDQYRIALALGICVAELFPQAVQGDKARLALLQQLESKYGAIPSP